jgi:hypothetical protein
MAIFFVVTVPSRPNVKNGEGNAQLLDLEYEPRTR